MTQDAISNPPPSSYGSDFSANGPAIVVSGLSKKYRDTAVLQDVSLQVNAGEVYALTGPNGAGKTTLIRCMTGLAFPTAGRVALMGRDVQTDGPAARSHLGAVVEAPAKFYPQFTGLQNLNMHAQLSGMAPDARKVSPERVREVLALLELSNMADQPVATYSLGQRQRLGVAAAIMAHPKVLILDEPTSGLDAVGIGLIHRIITGMSRSGCAVILSTHHLREISTYADKVGILSSGRMVDTVDLKARVTAYRFRVTAPAAAAELLVLLPFVQKVHVSLPYVIAQIGSEKHVPDVLNLLLSRGFDVTEATPDHFDLYEYYRERVE